MNYESARRFRQSQAFHNAKVNSHSKEDTENFRKEMWKKIKESRKKA